MHPNVDLISSFYRAFAAGDHATMAGAYDDTARFSDPVFPDLDADQARAMWRMFCLGESDVQVTHSDVTADDTHGSARWEASYKFPKTGRPVHNQIAATFDLRDGLIVNHRDHFDLYKWTRMALGPVGVFLGWTPLVKGQVRKQARAQLERFRAQEAK